MDDVTLLKPALYRVEGTPEAPGQPALIGGVCGLVAWLAVGSLMISVIAALGAFAFAMFAGSAASQARTGGWSGGGFSGGGYSGGSSSSSSDSGGFSGEGGSFGGGGASGSW